MEGLIGAGLGVVGMLTVVLVGYALNTRLFKEVDEAQDARKSAEEIAKHETAKNAVLEKNNAALDSQVASLKTNNETLTAQLQAVEKVAHDLRASITNTPSALPAALLAQLDRLRTHTQVPAATVATAGGDPGSGETGTVHGATDDKPS